MGFIGMKRLFILTIFVFFCFAFSSCNTKPPIHTIDSSESAATDLSTQISTAENTEITSLITEHILTESQPAISPVEPDEIVLCETPITLIYPRYQWLWRRGMKVDTSEDNPFRICIQIPQRWLLSSEQYGSSYNQRGLYEVSREEKVNLHMISKYWQLSILPGFKSCFEGTTNSGKDYFIIQDTSSSTNGDGDFDFFCYIRVSENYMFYFSVEGVESADLDSIITALDTVELTGDIQYHNPEAISNTESENLKFIEIPKIYIVSYHEWLEQSELNGYLKFALPESWHEIDVGNNMYARQDFPEYAIAPETERCDYPYIGEFLLVKTDKDIKLDADFHYKMNRMVPYNYRYPENSVYVGVMEGNTPYVLYRTDIKEHHAVEYIAYARLSDTYVVNFDFCVDLDMADLIYEVIDSMNLVITS